MFSSNVYTIPLLFTFIFFFWFAKKLTKCSHLLVFFIINHYFIYKINSRTYALTFLKNNPININLQNGLINIHPSLIYFMYASIVIMLLYLYSCDNHITFFFKNSSKIYNVLVLSLLGVYLGGFWANQELNWGGFWSWDPVEIVSFLGICFYIKLLHSRNNYTSNQKVIIYLIIVWLVYIIIRLGVVSTIHSFIRANNVGIYVNISVIFIIFYWLFSIFTKTNQYVLIIKYYVYKNVYKVQITSIYIYTYTYMIYLVCSTQLPWFLFKISEFYIFTLLFISTYFIFLTMSSFYVTYLYIFFNVLLGVYLFYNAYNITAILIFFYLFLTNSVRFYVKLHLLLFFVYILYFLFMLTLPTYNSQTTNIYYTYTSMGSAIVHDKIDLYELAFFLKKKFFLANLKSFIAHVKGFRIQHNGILSFYLFYKQTLIKYLFSIEYIYMSVYTATLIIVTYIRLHFINSTVKDDIV